ncbi:hypothetical protein A2U01_0050078 [Trifolium medium]|uniref:Uncharacterized protein n=1 Tax=Trifolium medium TaxID=97028 RepID=A0A392QZB9_9FABA|nr:hypothetical protein [Trifolium medium]
MKSMSTLCPSSGLHFKTSTKKDIDGILPGARGLGIHLVTNGLPGVIPLSNLRGAYPCQICEGLTPVKLTGTPAPSVMSDVCCLTRDGNGCP